MQNDRLRWQMLLPLGILLLTTMACGGFQIRVTPAAKPTAQPTVPVAATPRPVLPTATVALAPTRALPTPAPISTPTPAPAGMAIGASARVSASGGVNMRDTPTTSGKTIGRLESGIVVALRDGPKDADGYTWWQVDDGKGLVGWVATGTKDDPWLAPERGSGPAAGGSGKLVKRAVRLGDRVQVTTEQNLLLTVRESAGKDSPATARALPGTQFIVRGGPIRQDGLLWWQLEGDQIKGWAAEGDDTDRWLTPIEP